MDYKDPSFILPFNLHLCTIATRFEDWAEDLGLDYKPENKQPPPYHQAQTGVNRIGDHEILGSNREDLLPPDEILDDFADTFVHRIENYPTAVRCEHCGLPNSGQKCHKLINVEIANKILRQRPDLERAIFKENKPFPTFQKRNYNQSQSHGHFNNKTGGSFSNRPSQDNKKG